MPQRIYAALEVPKDRRLAPAAISWIGIAGCCGLALSLPAWSVAMSAALLLALAALRWIVRGHANATARG